MLLSEVWNLTNSVTDAFDTRSELYGAGDRGMVQLNAEVMGQ